MYENPQLYSLFYIEKCTMAGWRKVYAGEDPYAARTAVHKLRKSTNKDVRSFYKGRFVPEMSWAIKNPFKFENGKVVPND